MTQLILLPLLAAAGALFNGATSIAFDTDAPLTITVPSTGTNVLPTVITIDHGHIAISGGAEVIVSIRHGLYSPPPVATMGNGLLEPGEQCDDGNLTNGDGCSSNGKAEQSHLDLLPGSGGPAPFPAIGHADLMPQVICVGNGIREGGEQCDDGNSDDCDGCNVLGMIVPIPTMGNDIVETPCEECDDGNLTNGDGCSSEGKLENPTSPAATP